MKRLFFILSFVLAFTTMTMADVVKLQTTEIAYKVADDYGNWGDWTDWEPTSVLIVLNTDNDRINIYSKTEQVYDIFSYGDEETEANGATSFTLKCVDADGDRCNVRIRYEKNGNIQLYVDYSDIMFVYNAKLK